MNVKFNIRGVEEIKAYLKTLPRGVVKVGLKAIGEWMLGTPQRGLRRYQPYKYITRKRAYGQTFSSDKQRRYVMAKIREGRIDPGVPHRTGNVQRGWTLKESKGGYGFSISNKAPGAYWAKDDAGQARLNALAGWRKVSADIAANLAGALRHANTKIGEFLKRR